MSLFSLGKRDVNHGTWPPAGSPAGRSFGDHGADGAILVGRLLIGLVFVRSGFDKLLHIDGFAAGLAHRGLPFSHVWAWIGASVEFFGALFLMVGAGTRAVALLMALFVIVATGLSHRYWEFAAPERRAQEVNFYKNIAMLGGILFLYAAGGGRFSIDRLWRGSRRTER